MAVMGGRDDHAVDVRHHTPSRRPRVVLAAVPPEGRGGPAPAPAAERSQDHAEPAVTGRRAPFVTVALAGLCLLVVDTAVGVLPDDALAPDLPLLSVLTIQRLVVIVCLVCLAIAAPRPSTFRTPVDLPLLALVAVAAVALLQDGQSMAAWRGLVTAVAVFYVAVGVLRRHADAVPVLLVAVLGAAFVAAAIGVQQAVDGVDTGFYRVGLQNSEADADGAVTRSTGTFSNPNLLAGYLILALPLTVGLFGRRSGRRLRVAWLVLAGIAVGGLVVTFSRGALAALAAVIVIGLVARAAARRGRALALLVLAAVAGGLVVTVAAAAATGVLGRVTGRDGLWSAATTAAGTGGLSGVGYGRAGDVMSAVGDEAFAHAHNLWLNWLVETGPLGPVLITLVLLIALVAGVRRALGGSALAGGAVAGLGAITLASVLDHPTTVSPILTLALVAVACSVAGPVPPAGVRGRHVRDPAAEPAPVPAPVPAPPPPPVERRAPVAEPWARRPETPAEVPEGYPPVPRPVSVPRRLTYESDRREHRDDGTRNGYRRNGAHADGAHVNGDHVNGAHVSGTSPDGDTRPAALRPADETAPVPAARRPRRALRTDGD